MSRNSNWPAILKLVLDPAVTLKKYYYLKVNK